MTTILFSAGDASGDLHTADLAHALHAKFPDATLFGVGGEQMAKAGVELIVHQRELAIGGFVEVLASANRIFAAWRRLRQALNTKRPDLVVLVDSPDFNLPFAKSVRRAGIPILYYVSPQVWAWRRARMEKLAARVDRIAAIFPFEPAIYQSTPVRVDFVGHPLLDKLQNWFQGRSREEVRQELGVHATQKIVALLPGSRRNEIRYNLKLQIETARLLRARMPELAFLLPVAPTVSKRSIEDALTALKLPADFPLLLVEGKTYEALFAADAVLGKPGTNTVEVALLARPLVVAGRAHPLSVAVAKRIIHVPSFAMPNLIAGAPVVPEFLQEQAKPERIAEALQLLLEEGPVRALHLQRMAEIRAHLGLGGAAARTAAICEEMIRAPRQA